MTRKVQKGPRETIAHHLSALAAAKTAAPAASARGGAPRRRAPSISIAANAAGYATRITAYTSRGGSIPPRARWARSLRRARSDSSAIRRKRSEEHTSELQSLRHLVCRL